MRIVTIFGLIMAVPLGLLAISQVSDLEDDLAALTTGATNLMVNDLTFMFYVLVVFVTLGLAAAVAKWLMS